MAADVPALTPRHSRHIYQNSRSIIVWTIENCFSDSVNLSVHTKFYGHDARVWKCEWLRFDGTLYLCSIGEDLKCCIWNIDKKKLEYRFSAIRKGSKNIWSLFVNENDACLITGWGDGGMRRYELRNYLTDDQMAASDADNSIEWCVEYEADDFPKTIQLVNSCIVVCTNNGRIYMTLFEDGKQTLVFSHSSLRTYNCMAKLTTSQSGSYLAIGSLYGQIFLLSDFESGKKANVKMITSVDDTENRNHKVFSLIWQKTADDRYYLLASLTFLDGLLQLYELDTETKQLRLSACLALPACKHRWSTSFTVFTTDRDYLVAGDKCGNLNLYELAIGDNTLSKPVQTLSAVTKHGLAMTAIYFKDGQLVCCSRDGFYRLFKLDTHEPLALVNKFDINTCIDAIESFVFNDFFSNKNHRFNMEHNITLGLCFYGDKFLLWSFFLNRSIIEIKCGGLKRSWDNEFNLNQASDKSIEFMFVYIKNKSVIKLKKKIHTNEIMGGSTSATSHLTQAFHGNSIACCKYFGSYLITGSEDTHAILTHIDNDGKRFSHEFYLQGHNSVVKCLCVVRECESFALVLTAGGKAIMKLWKVFVDEKIKKIIKTEQICEFKKFTKTKDTFKPWLYSDLESNPDIRLMAVDVAHFESDNYFLYFACSDGSIRQVFSCLGLNLTKFFILVFLQSIHLCRSK
jgi:WD40 repeat protein